MSIKQLFLAVATLAVSINIFAANQDSTSIKPNMSNFALISAPGAQPGAMPLNIVNKTNRIDGACGLANGTTPLSPPATNLCLSGTR